MSTQAGAHELDPERVRVLVTVGTELPFDRLVRAVDGWAARNGVAADVFAQIGDTDYRPTHIPWAPFVDAPAFERAFRSCDLVVAHAGMGTILSSLRERQPLLVMPRRADLGEHRNDHQLATARRLSAAGRLEVAIDEGDLVRRLDRSSDIAPPPEIGPFADDALVNAVAQAIERLGREKRGER